MWLTAMICCKTIGCPHPSRLHEEPWCIDWPKLIDWYVFFLWENGIKDDEATDADRVEFLRNIAEMEAQAEEENAAT